MDQTPEFNFKSYLSLLAKWSSIIVVALGTAGWTAFQVAGELSGSAWGRNLVIATDDGFSLDEGVYAIGTLPLATGLLVVILGCVTLIVSLLYAIVGPRRLRKRLKSEHASQLQDLERDTRSRLDAAEDRNRQLIMSLMRDYDELIERFKRLSRILYSPQSDVISEPPSAIIIRSKTSSHEIEADLDGRSIEYYSIEAGDEPAHFWKYFITTDADAEAVRTPTGLAFDARFTAGHGSVIVIPTSNRPREKEFALFFDPPIEPGGRRTIKIEYRWPGYWRHCLFFPKK